MIQDDFKVSKTQRIGLRLNIVLLSIIVFFLVASGFGIWTLQQQTKQFNAITQTYYDRAMLAAELSRDAELIATQAMEKTVTQQLGKIDANVLQTDITKIFTVARDSLVAHSDREAELIDRVDVLTRPYFDQILAFYKMIEQQLRQELRLRDIERGLARLQPSPFTDARNELTPYISDTTSALLFMLRADSPGLLSRRTRDVTYQLEQLAAFRTDDPAQQQTIAELQDLASQALSLKMDIDQTRMRTLAAMRETRLYAQRLSGASYDFYLYVKSEADTAALEHSRHIESVSKMIVGFCLVFLLLIGVAYWLIQRILIQRLNRLSSVMLQHVEGEPVPIPQSGQDEISIIGKAFSVFVEANQASHQKAQEAQHQAEEANQKLRKLNASLHEQSNTDELTATANRRSFFNWLRATWPTAKDKGSSFGVLMIDIDWFKRYNDHYGHLAGDLCLQQVAKILRTTVGSNQGMLARYGGEEFIVAAAGITQAQINKLGHALLKGVVDAQLPHTHSPKQHITISVGIAYFDKLSAEDTSEKVIALADQALYEAKAHGRANVVTLNTTDS